MKLRNTNLSPKLSECGSAYQHEFRASEVK